MRAELEKISNKPTNSFLVKVVQRAQRSDFKSAYHYHPEYELIWTTKSRGRRFIGSNFTTYEPGELIFLGKNLPHCWITNEPCEQRVIQMREDFLGSDFMNTPECLSIRNMFKESYRGLEFFGKTKERVQEKISDLYDLEEGSFKRLMLLLEILSDLADSEEFEYLSLEEYRTAYNQKEFERIQIIYDYIHNNFENEVSIDEATQLIHLTKSAFCKFIKRKTKKTFSQIVNEVRLHKATELLIETDKSIMQICYEVGFNDPSYFFRQFSKLMGASPKEFRQSYS